jgi:hypothetical protein
MRKLTFLGIFVFCLALLPRIQAQELTARIHGTVTDASGGGVPGAEVKATNTLTQVPYTTTTEADGTYRFLALPVGTYDITVTKTGFRTFTARGILLVLNQDYDESAQLQVGQVTESVQVEANPVQVETTNTQISTVIQSQAIVDMPLNGRNWTTMQQLVPGVVATSDRMGTYASNGSQSQQNSFLINGADAIDLPLNTPLVIPSPDAIAEFNMITSTINPEYGRNSGAILNAIIKSGTNAFHGDAFEFYRDTFLNGRNLFQQSGPVFHQNQFGGTLGGPIIKDHTFFFISYQGTRARQPQAANTTTVFTAGQRAGNFSDLATSSGASPFPLVGEDGTTYPAGTPYSTIFPTGRIPAADLNPIASKLVSTYVPLPNVAGSSLYSFNPVVNNTIDQGIARIDHVMAHDAIWASMLFQNQPTSSTLPFTGSSLPGFTELDYSARKNISADWTHTFNGSTLNELRASWLRFNYQDVYPTQISQPSSFGFTGISPQFPQYASLPFIGITGYFNLGFATSGPQPRIDSTYELADNFSKVVGRHTMKFGFDGKRYNVDNPFAFENSGNFSFGGNGPYTTGDPGADFLLGIPDSYAQSSGGAIFAKTYEYYFYAQDQFKVSSNLTLNYGIGYQIDTPLVNSNAGGDLNCFIPGQQSKIFPTAPVGLDFPGDAGCTASGYHNHYDHFGPRAGFAYSPDLGWLTGGAGKTVIRGGFGVYFNRTEEELTLQNLLAAPYSIFSLGVGDIGGSPSFAAPFTDISTGQAVRNKFPFTAPTKGSNVDFSFFEPLGFSTLNPNFTAPYAMNYNLNIQRELPGSMILQVGYFGAQGRHLETTYEGNPISPTGQAACAADPTCIAERSIQSIAFPTHTLYAPGNIFATVGVQATVGDSNYNSLQVSLQKRMSHGVWYQLSYTYSHSIDDTSGYENSAGNNAAGGASVSTNPYNLEGFYGDSAFDARHRFVASYDWELPSAFHNNGILHSVVDGWTVTGITVLQTGFPLTIFDSADRSLICNGSAVSYYGCPDTAQYIGSGGVPMYDARTSVNSKTASTPTHGPQPYYWFNPNVFAHPAYGTLGNEGRNNFHGPGINNTDLSLFKRFHYGGEEARWVELRLEAYNVFNHTQFSANVFQGSGYSPVVSNINSQNFGRTLGAATGRVIQLGAKVYF